MSRARLARGRFGSITGTNVDEDPILLKLRY
jgi:hypothetical protein